MADILEPLMKIAEAIRVEPCGDGKFGVYLRGSASSYIGLSSPQAEEHAINWRNRIIAEMTRAATRK